MEPPLPQIYSTVTSHELLLFLEFLTRSVQCWLIDAQVRGRLISTLFR